MVNTCNNIKAMHQLGKKKYYFVKISLLFCFSLPAEDNLILGYSYILSVCTLLSGGSFLKADPDPLAMMVIKGKLEMIFII